LLGAYIAIFWLLAQGFASLFPVLGVPNWVLRVFIVAGTAAIPLLAFMSWKYNLVPPQLVRDPKDLEASNPALSWASRRHDNSNAGHLLLRWRSGTAPPAEKRFFRPVSIGREAGNDIELPDQCVSRHHAVLWAEGGAWRVRDLDSTNGTFLGHERLTVTATLPDACELRFHSTGPVVEVTIDRPTETVLGTQTH
jgi:hypothetical protein